MVLSDALYQLLCLCQEKHDRRMLRSHSLFCPPWRW